MDAALTVVTTAKVPEPLAATAFEIVLRSLLIGVDNGESAAARADGGEPKDGNRLELIAKRVGVPTERIREIYDETIGDLRLVVANKRISRNQANGSRELTLLVAGGRQAAGLEEWTAFAQPRAVCAEYGRLDSGNYSTTIKAMGREFSFRGSGQSRELRLTMPGWDAWSDLVQRLLQAPAPSQ